MPYRLIYNQDCSHLFGRTSEAITPAHVDEMVDEVAPGGAELMLINPNTQRANYPSKVWQTFNDWSNPGKPHRVTVARDARLRERSRIDNPVRRTASAER